MQETAGIYILNIFSSAMYAADYAYGYQHISKPIPIPTSDKEPR
jgi:hypothetical protein